MGNKGGFHPGGRRSIPPRLMENAGSWKVARIWRPTLFQTVARPIASTRVAKCPKSSNEILPWFCVGHGEGHGVGNEVNNRISHGFGHGVNHGDSHEVGLSGHVVEGTRVIQPAKLREDAELASKEVWAKSNRKKSHLRVPPWTKPQPPQQWNTSYHFLAIIDYW